MHPFLVFTAYVVGGLVVAPWMVSAQSSFLKSSRVHESPELGALLRGRIRRWTLGARVCLVTAWLIGLWIQLTVGFERVMA